MNIQSGDQKSKFDNFEKIGCTSLSTKESITINAGDVAGSIGEWLGCYIGSLLANAKVDFVNSQIHGPNGNKFM